MLEAIHRKSALSTTLKSLSEYRFHPSLTSHPFYSHKVANGFLFSHMKQT